MRFGLGSNRRPEAAPSASGELPILGAGGYRVSAATPSRTASALASAAAACAELPQDRGYVVIHRLHGQEQPFGYLRVLQAERDELQHLELAPRQLGGIVTRRCGAVPSEARARPVPGGCARPRSRPRARRAPGAGRGRCATRRRRRRSQAPGPPHTGSPCASTAPPRLASHPPPRGHTARRRAGTSSSTPARRRHSASSATIHDDSRSAREVERRLRLLQDDRRAPLEPGGLRSCRGNEARSAAPRRSAPRGRALRRAAAIPADRRDVHA